MDITKLYEKQISMTEWFENIKHSQTETLRAEDNEKRERMRILNEVIGLPFDKPYQFTAQEVADQPDHFKEFLEKHGEELCALRLIPTNSTLPKLRMRGHAIRDALKWFKEQEIDYSKYKADFVPHPKTPIWSSIFIVNSKGIFGEIIKGGHHQLTQGFHQDMKPISFSFDFSEWKFSEDNGKVKAHAEEIVKEVVVEGEQKRNLLKDKINADFTGDYLRGYFETVKSKDKGLCFVDYNRILADLYNEILPVIKSQGEDNLSGQAASLGKVKGKVRIVAPEQVGETSLEKDDILVCNVTTPDYFNIMNQSLGIITDGGGTLSHAGIVARELGKPCVVGTGNATEVLKNGDLIELDANNGVIRKLQEHKVRR